ncbi:2Fe-2S iron-sulfur cluster-binding protein [Pokkaliibacter sp. MBI-7]|uniref:2Fe-2S iron-sulfur cluster-binding protein n=1 Tax=Pokkaliibacter sp. MBI-7 TaxID=3040600 RepID=UPI00244A1FEB|nr:2Fe-2S iron-sulfur cluster-binding protein [Pokkaliibacter sp. MBI-7]MDH2432262.1 2Fe-2S iron-sulfur cluster-binding protein [Pokkaliibacter sp. MBI-7]
MPWLRLPELALEIDLGATDLQAQPLSADVSSSPTLLAALQARAVPVRQACRNGVCGICQCTLLSGAISYRGVTPHGLNQRELAAHRVLTCIAYADSEEVVLSKPCFPPRN